MELELEGMELPETEQVSEAVESATQQNIDKEKQPIGKRIEQFFDRYYALFFAPLIVMFLYLAALSMHNVYPFGNEYTAASYDLSAQICPFIEHLFDVFQGKSKLTYSYAIIGGADVTGTFLYFFVSPFSFLFLIFGDGMVAHASSIVMLCKVMAVAFAGTWFAKTQFKGIPDYICIAIGVVYTYCGYMFVANTYINWVDFLIYMPFCVWGFKYFVQKDKFLPFSALVAACIYTCFSIACFAMFTVFPALIIYGLLCVDKDNRYKFLAKLCLAFVVALLIALPVLLPALAAFTNSARGGGLFENFWYGFNTVSQETGLPSNFDSSDFVDQWSTSLYEKWSYIFSDSIFVVLTVVWFFRRGLKDNFAKFMLIAGVLTLLPTVVDESMNLLNMGSYMSYALRFGFLNAIYFLGGACLAIEGWCYDSFNQTYDGSKLLRLIKKRDLYKTAKTVQKEDNAESVISENEGGMSQAKYENTARRYESVMSKRMHNRAVYILSGVFLVLAAVAAILIVAFTSNENYIGFWENFISDSSTLDSLDSFSGRFAHSLGGLEIIIIPFVIVAIVAIIGCLMVAVKKISPRMLSIALIVVVGTQVIFYNNQLVIGNRSTQHVKVGYYQTLCAELNERDSSYFRVKDYSDSLTSAIPFTGNTNAFSAFSSVLDEDNFVCWPLFGYKGNSKNNFKSAHSGKGNRSDEFGDSFLGYKYFFVPEKNKASAASKSYLKPVVALDENGNPILDKDGNEVQLSEGGYYIFENEIVFPSGYVVADGEFRFPVENIDNKDNRKLNQQALYEFLRGKNLVEFTHSQFVTPTSARELSDYLWTKAAEVEVGAGVIKASVTAKKGESLFLNFVASKGYTVTVNGKAAKLEDNDLKFLAVELEEGYNEVVFTYSSPYVKYMALGAGGGLVALCAVAVVLKKTKLIETCAPVIAWAGIGLAAAVLAFFMLYPTCAFIVKLFLLA